MGNLVLAKSYLGKNKVTISAKGNTGYNMGWLAALIRESLFPIIFIAHFIGFL
jgi:hypothetical protein